MKPPICAVCHERFGLESGGLVAFARAPGDADWYRRAAAPGFKGHPPNVGWFCAAHVGPARGLSDRTLGEALRRIRGGEAEE